MDTWDSDSRPKGGLIYKIRQIPKFYFNKLLLISNETSGRHYSKNNIVVGYDCNGHK